ncbi:MAG TPA: hypothetical protein VG897_13710 [Terriglobales bacterium]|nr:hypothetical protein [Terriglobales bacterium]
MKRSRAKGEDMQLIQIGARETEKTISIREMFEQLAQKEADMIREARERAAKRARKKN